MRARWLLPSAWAIVLAASSHAQAVDPRSPGLRAALALAPGDSVAVWVFFAAEAAASAGGPALSQEAIAQRVRLGIADLANDRPLPARLVSAVEATGARIRFRSRWLRAVSVWADSAVASRLAQLPEVRRVQPVGVLRSHDVAHTRTPPDPPLTDRADPSFEIPESGNRPAARSGGAVASQPRAASGARIQADSAFYGPNWRALLHLDIPPAHILGFTGKGIRIAILDTGFEPRHEALASRLIEHTRDFINGDSIVYTEPGDPTTFDQEQHGTGVFSLLGGYAPGQVVGPGYDARFVLAKVDEEVAGQPHDTQADEDRWVAAVEWADSLDARIISSSLAYRYAFIDQPAIPYGALNGDSTITTRIADEAARRGILLVNAMGNDGPNPGTLSAPADADSILAVGAVDAAGNVASFSSRGPTADGRIKPDLAARGVNLHGASNAAFDAYGNLGSGTSFATPLIAGAAAMFMQAWPDLNGQAVRNALLRASDHAAAPDNAVGAGVPDVSSAILFPDGLSTAGVATVDLAGTLTTVAPTFRWAAPLILGAMRPILYRLQVATDPDFSTIIYTDTVTESFSLTVRKALRPQAAIWWRVRAESRTGVTRTSRGAGPLEMPHWVRMLSPDPNKAIFVTSPRPDFSWVPLAAPAPIGPFTYDVEVLSLETGEPVQPTIRDVTGSTVRVPLPLAYNVAYRWRVIAHTTFGVADTVESVAPFVVTSASQPPVTLLYQNFPNPFPRLDLGVSSTRIWFDLSQHSAVELAVYDLRGRLIRRLIPALPTCGVVSLDAGLFGRFGGSFQEDPCVRTTWDGNDAEGRQVPAGVYILRFRANGESQTRRMLFLPGRR